MQEVIVQTAEGKFQQRIEIGRHVLVGDEPVNLGGDDAGPSPFDYLLAALGTCTSMTIKMYADRKEMPLKSVHVALSLTREGDKTNIRRRITLTGDLSEEQRSRLLEIANKCPVHKTLTGTIQIESLLA